MAKATPTKVATPQTDGLINFRAAAERSGLSEQYFRTLLRKGKVPTGVATKNELGYWRIDPVTLDAWMSEREANPRTHTSADGRRWYKIRLNGEEADMVRGAIEGTGLELVVASRSKPKAKAAPVEAE